MNVNLDPSLIIDQVEAMALAAGEPAKLRPYGPAVPSMSTNLGHLATNGSADSAPTTMSMNSSCWPSLPLGRCHARPVTSDAEADHRLHRCWLQRATGDALQAIGCAAGYNIR